MTETPDTSLRDMVTRLIDEFDQLSQDFPGFTKLPYYDSLSKTFDEAQSWLHNGASLTNLSPIASATYPMRSFYPESAAYKIIELSGPGWAIAYLTIFDRCMEFKRLAQKVHDMVLDQFAANSTQSAKAYIDALDQNKLDVVMRDLLVKLIDRANDEEVLETIDDLSNYEIFGLSADAQPFYADELRRRMKHLINH